MAKTIYITESQFKSLVEKKKEEKKIFNQICEELNQKKASLTEAAALNEGVIDTVKKYLRAGALTAAIIGSLLSAGQVNAQQLQQAGVPTELVQQGLQKVKHDPSQMSTKQIEQRLVQIMRQNNLDGSLKTFNQLNPQQKENVLNGIKSQIKSLDDINHVSFGNWEKYDKSGENMVKFDQQSKSVVRVVTIDTLSTVPVAEQFAHNSYQLSNPDSTKQAIHDLIIGFTHIDSISIESSSSTLRNKGDAEGMTWKELSQKRAEEIANLMIGEKVDVGGCGLNKNGEITAQMITINSDGTNGDGTSGPKSPYEVGEYAQTYVNRGIDAKLWKSASQQEALPETELDSYQQFQYVNIIIHGRVVENETQEIPSFRYVYLQVKKAGGEIKKGDKKESSDIQSCSIQVKVPQKVDISK